MIQSSLVEAIWLFLRYCLVGSYASGLDAAARKPPDEGIVECGICTKRN